MRTPSCLCLLHHWRNTILKFLCHNRRKRVIFPLKHADSFFQMWPLFKHQHTPSSRLATTSVELAAKVTSVSADPCGGKEGSCHSPQCSDTFWEDSLFRPQCPPKSLFGRGFLQLHCIKANKESYRVSLLRTKCLLEGPRASEMPRLHPTLFRNQQTNRLAYDTHRLATVLSSIEKGWSRSSYDICSSTCIMAITTDRAVWFVMWLRGRVQLFETLAGKTLSDITWWSSESEREEGDGCLSWILTRHVSICLILTQSLLTPIILPLYLGDSFWNEPPCYRVTGFTFSVELMELNLMTVYQKCILYSEQVFIHIHVVGSPSWESHSVDGEHWKLTGETENCFWVILFSFQYC